MRGTDDVVALDFPGVCGVVFLVRESDVGETDFADCGVGYVSCGVAGLSFDAEQACAYFSVGGVFYWEKGRAVGTISELSPLRIARYRTVHLHSLSWGSRSST